MNKSVIHADDIKNAFDYRAETEFEWRGLTIGVKRYLPLTEMMGFVSGVAQACFIADSGEYVPEIKDFAIRCAVMEYYAGIELPDDLEEKCDLVYGSDIVEAIVSHIDDSQFDSLCEAINRKINNIAQSHIEALNKQMEEVMTGFNDLEEKLSKMLGGIDDDTISKVAGAITNGAFDEGRLVQAFKDNLAHTPAGGK